MEEQEKLIRERTYQLYLMRGNSPGSAEDDWYCATQQIKSELQFLRSHHEDQDTYTQGVRE